MKEKSESGEVFKIIPFKQGQLEITNQGEMFVLHIHIEGTQPDRQPVIFATGQKGKNPEDAMKNMIERIAKLSHASNSILNDLSNFYQSEDFVKLKKELKEIKK